jgi:3-deoxy-D-manno-octulosonic-acid transferase
MDAIRVVLSTTENILRYLYTALLYLLTPFVLLRLCWRGLRAPAYWRRWGERFGCYHDLDLRAAIWIHAVSVGEVVAAEPLVRALRLAHPHAPLLITTMTPTGSEQVQRLFHGEVRHVYVPYDLPVAVRRFLERARPRLALIMETELWPNLFHGCRTRGIPVIVANARLSERSAAGYARFARLTRATLRDVSVIAAQSAADAERFRQLLGLKGSESFDTADRLDQHALDQMTPTPLIPLIQVTGSIKFDMRLPAGLREQAEVLRRDLGVDRPVWIAASTHEGEEELVLDAFAQVRAQLADVLLLLVPRHPERFARVAALCEKRGLSPVLRSSHLPCRPDSAVFLGDSMGELPLFYAAADLAFIGGSLMPTGGHNPLEAAALGVPLLFGPHMFNFAEISRLLLREKAALQVRDAQALADSVVLLLRDAEQCHALGENGRRVVEANRGALERLMKIVTAYLGDTA